MSGNETTTDLLAKELRDLDVEVGQLTQEFTITAVELLKKGILPSIPSAEARDIRDKYRRMKELENALNMVC